MALAIGANDKTKVYMLGGLLAAVGAVAVVLYIPRGGDKPGAPAKSTAAPSKTPEKTSPATPGAPGAKPAGSPAGGVTAASLLAVTQFRDDPFMQFQKPKPPPLPEARGGSGPGRGPGRTGPSGGGGQPDFSEQTSVPIMSPDELNVLSPGEGDSSGGGGGLPPMDANRQGTRTPVLSRTAKIDWPKVDIPRSVAAPVKPKSLEEQNGTGGMATSSDKRVSGVIIGDSVRAMLVMPDGTTRIVQPGDEIDGIRVLRIERVTEGGRSVTRVIIREDGEERAVILKMAEPVPGAGPGMAPRPAAPAGRPGR